MKLDVLLALVDIYEAKRWSIEVDETFDPVDVISYAIDELGHTHAELSERSRASEILSRRRAHTVDMIHKISKTWKIPADLLVRPYKLLESSAPLHVIRADIATFAPLHHQPMKSIELCATKVAALVKKMLVEAA
jgi:HTH-type transcriptional regulator/antitoxin HigA